MHQRIARGFYGRVAGAGHEEPEDGYDVVTTLDLDLQDVADKALRRQLERQNALWGTTIVMETHTGEILAMVNLGRNADGASPNGRTTPWAAAWSPARRSSWRRCSRCWTMPHVPETIYDTHNGDPVQVGPAGTSATRTAVTM